MVIFKVLTVCWKGVIMTNHFEEDLRKAEAFHGHVCTGIVLGVRIARAGLQYLGIDDPEENKDFIVYIETDRCLTDAIQAVTGCSLGKRRLKWIDYGKMAASFIDMNTGNGVRISIRSHRNPPEGEDMLTFWKGFTDEELFRIEPVKMDIKKEDLPGPATKITTCEVCHENVMDGRDVTRGGKVLCKACAGTTYDLHPIGYVKSEIKESNAMPIGGIDAQIEISPEYKEALSGVDQYSHLWILSWFHLSQRDKLKVVPRKTNPDAGEFGVFALRTPVRPNPIALTLVKLEKLEGNTLYVSGMDAVDGTSVVDIKPYNVNDIIQSPKTLNIQNQK